MTAAGVSESAFSQETAALRERRITSTELTRLALARAEALENGTRAPGAFTQLCPREALADAARADAALARGTHLGPLHGVPVAVKDLLDVDGLPTRMGTPGLGRAAADGDSEAVRRLREGGAVVIGKTSTHELAYGMTTPAARNPASPGRMTGGSSGGSAAAVAAGVVRVAIGTDTGGSVRNPATLCGVYGLKAAHGTTPLGGVAPLAPSQDCLGVLADSVEGCAAALSVLTGTPQNTTCARPPRVGVIDSPWARRVAPEVERALGLAVSALSADGPCPRVRVPLSELASAVSYVTLLAEASHEWWPEVRSRPGAVSGEVGGLLHLGNRVTAVDYLRARRVARCMSERLDASLNGLDALLLAGAPVPAPELGASTVTVRGRSEPVASAHSRLTALASVTGAPALSVPVPAAPGPPVGVQVIARDAATACRVGSFLAEALPRP